MTGSNSRLALVMFGGLALAGCVGNSEKPQAQKPLEDIVFIEGVPGMPVISLDYRAGSNLGFPLRGPSGEYLCTYHGTFLQKEKVNETATAIVDAHEDGQSLLVSGKLNGKTLEIYKISHPDFGTFVLKNFSNK